MFHANQVSPRSPTSGKVATLNDLQYRQENILRRLENLQAEVRKLQGVKDGNQKVTRSAGYKMHKPCAVHVFSANDIRASARVEDVVINASPAALPYSVLILYELLKQQYSVKGACYSHSSVNKVAPELLSVFGSTEEAKERSACQIIITLIWKEVPFGPSLLSQPNIQTAIFGEASVARYLARLLNPPYDVGDIALATEVDNWLDLATQLYNGNAKEKTAAIKAANNRLHGTFWLVGDKLSLADILFWSVLKRTQQQVAVPENLHTWMTACSKNPAFATAVKL